MEGRVRAAKTRQNRPKRGKMKTRRYVYVKYTLFRSYHSFTVSVTIIYVKTQTGVQPGFPVVYVDMLRCYIQIQTLYTAQGPVSITTTFV